MKVGDYVRTDNGTISKIKWVIEEQGTLNKTISGKYQCENKEVYLYPDEFKSSPNIIDLIEEKDYVNGSPVNCINYDLDKEEDIVESITIILPYQETTDTLYEKDIKSIVTKEQFSQMEYRIGE